MSIAGALPLAAVASATEPEVMIVTGTRIPTPLNRVGGAVSIITADEIEARQQRFVIDSLKLTPGIQVIQSGGTGSVATVSIRGLATGQTLVVVDGVVVNDPSTFDNGFDFGSLDTNDIEQIEVLRGAQSALYGSDAIGGVINIVTKSGSEGFGGSAYAEGGSFETVSGAATLRGGSARASGRLSVSGTATDGISAADEANGNTEPDGFNRYAISAKGQLGLTDAMSLSGVVRYAKSDVDFDGFVFAPVDGDQNSEREDLVAGAFLDIEMFGGRLENRFSISHAETSSINTELGAVSFDAKGERLALEYQGTARIADRMTFVVGGEYDEAKSEVATGFGADDEITVRSAYGLAQIRPVDRLTLTGGLRLDANSRYGDETTSSASVAYDVVETGSTLKASYQEGFRAPSLAELAFNPGLFAERSRGWDAGVEHPFWEGRVLAGLTYFETKVDDLIAFDLGLFNFFNIEEFESSGWEAQISAAVRDSVAVNAVYTYLDAMNVSRNTPAALRPDHRFTVDMDYRATDRLSFGGTLTYNGEETFAGASVAGYTLLAVRAAYQVSSIAEVYARVENATDEDYQDNPGYGTAPFAVTGGVRARF